MLNFGPIWEIFELAFAELSDKTHYMYSGLSKIKTDFCFLGSLIFERQLCSWYEAHIKFRHIVSFVW